MWGLTWISDVQTNGQDGSMYWVAFGLFCVVAVYKVIQERRRIGCSILVYVIILLLDLLVGTAIVAWKCFFTDNDDECKLATGGAVGSLAIWLMLILVFPLCAIKCDFHERWHNLREWYKGYLEKIRPRKPREIYIPSEIYLPTTLSLMDKSSQVEYIKGTSKRQGSSREPSLQRLVTSDQATEARQDVVYTFNEKASCPEQMKKFLDPDET